MKLPQLLAHFLYQNKSLALQDIGVFTLDPSAIIPQEPEKELPLIVQGIHFEHLPILKPDAALIEFIHKYTGKMKPLAESDLDSYLRLGIQLMNIGKPFYLEGIGYVTKNKEDKYEFEPGEYSFLKLDAPGEKRTEGEDKRKKTFEDQKIDYAPQSKAAKRVLLAIGLIGGIALIGWGGYSLYKTKMITKVENENSSLVAHEDTDAQQQKNDSPVNTLAQFDSSGAQKKDSAQTTANKKTDSSRYKFVILATANKSRALKRYKQLVSFDLNVKIETKDSSFFKVYFAIPASPKDTLHIKDSLSNYYATKTLIEQ